MKKTTKDEEEQLKIAELELRNTLAKIEKVREQMCARVNYNTSHLEMKDTLLFEECDALWNSIDCIGSALFYLHDVED